MGEIKSKLVFEIVTSNIVFNILGSNECIYRKGEFYYGSPSSVSKVLFSKFKSGELLYDTWITFYEVFIGFIIGNLIGTFLGLSFWYNEKLSIVLKPYVLVVGAIPAVAFAPLIILLVGIGIWSKIVLVIFSTVVVATMQAFEGASQTNPNYIRLLKSFGATGWLIFKKAIVPSSLVWLFAGFKLNIGFAILGAFVGEFISSDAGLGHMIEISKGLFRMPAVIAGIFMLGLLSVFFNVVITFLQRKFLPWEFNNKQEISE